jgi:hypothetical protein
MNKRISISIPYNTYILLFGYAKLCHVTIHEMQDFLIKKGIDLNLGLDINSLDIIVEDEIDVSHET